MGINPYNYNTLMQKVRDATVKLTEEVKAVATRALGRAEEAYEYAEEAGQIADTANRLAEDIIYTHLQYDENATYSKMVYGINILGQEPEDWLQDKRYNTTTGELEDYDNRICTDELISVTPGSKYIFSTYDCKGYIKQLRMSIVCYDADGEYVGYLSDKAGIFTVTIPSNTAKIGVTIFTNEPASSFTILTSIIGISIFPWSVTPLEEDTDATHIGMYSSNEQEIPDATDPASYIWKPIKTTEEGFTPIIPGADINEPGPPGISITRTVFEYAVNNSTTTAPTSGWSETQPDVTTENPVLWQRIKTSYSDGTTQYTGTVPSVVFQRIVTFINAAQSGAHGTVINGGAIDTESIRVDKLYPELIMDSSGNNKIYLNLGAFQFTNPDLNTGITWDTSELNIKANQIYFGQDSDTQTSINTALNDIERDLYDKDRYNTTVIESGVPIKYDVYYYDADEQHSTAGFYRVNLDGTETLISEDDLDKDTDGNIIVIHSLNSLFDSYKNEINVALLDLLNDLNSKSDATTVETAINTLNKDLTEFKESVNTDMTTLVNNLYAIEQQGNIYANYVKITENNGLEVGYTGNKQKVSITGNGFILYNKDGVPAAYIKAVEQTAEMEIPVIKTNYIRMSENYVFEYMFEDDSITLKLR